MPLFTFGQFNDYTITGESLWRNQGYGVSNHKFDIKDYLIHEATEEALDPDPVTGSCPYEYYTTDYMPLYNDEDVANNTLKIRPYSINNYADYTNGVSSVDLLAISNHVNSYVMLDSYSPTEDAPYRYISADADYNDEVELADAYMIEDLLLDYREDLTRNSWDWVLKDEVENSAVRFAADPYSFVIDENWSGSEGIILPGLTTDEIQADNDKFFTFRTTKIGDIVANSGWTYSSANSWVCGSGSYITGGEVESRSNIELDGKKVQPNTIISIEANLQANEAIYAYQIPIHFSKQDFQLVDIHFTDGFKPRWNYNDQINSLVLIDFAKTNDPLLVPTGKILQIKLKSIRKIDDIQKSISWDPNRAVEFVAKDLGNIDAYLELNITDILPQDLYLETRADGNNQEAYIESPTDQSVKFRVFNSEGLPIKEEILALHRGENHFPLVHDLVSGMYILQVSNEIQMTTSKVIIP